MKLNKRIINIVALLTIISVVSTFFAPCVYANSYNMITELETPNIIILENTTTSQVYQVGDYLLKVNYNNEHTNATMEIQNLTTLNKDVIKFNVTENNGSYTTQLESNGITNTLITDYDPLAPISQSPSLANSLQSIKSSQMSSNVVSTSEASWYWDGIPFVIGGSFLSSEPYAHPAYNALASAGTWDIIGDQLDYWHIDQDSSLKIVAAPTVLAALGILLAILLGIAEKVEKNLYGIVDVLDITDIAREFLSNMWEKSVALLDENNCIWVTVGTTDTTDEFNLPVHGSFGGYLRLSGQLKYDDFHIGIPDPNASSPETRDYTITLHPGWNLISVPVQLKNSNKYIGSFFPPDIASQIPDVWAYHAESDNIAAQWRYYSPQGLPKPSSNVYAIISEIKTISPYQGYYIYYNGPTDRSFTVSGFKPAFNTIPYNALKTNAWNLVGYPSLMASGLGSLYNNAQDIWSYNNAMWSYYSGQRYGSFSGYSPNYKSLTSLQPGNAYWVNTYYDSSIGTQNVINPPQVPQSTSGIKPPVVTDYFGYSLIDSNTQNGPSYGWIDITSDGTKILTDSDDSYVNGIPVGFFFNYYGTDYSQVSITNNGIVLASGGTGQYQNQPIGSSTPHNFISPYWDDLVTWGSADAIYYKTIGTAPNRQFVVEWNNCQHYSSSTSGITFEAILYEGTNNIKFQYKNVGFGTVSYSVDTTPPSGSYNNGGSATVGIEGSNGQGLQYSYNSPVIKSNLAILFKFPAFSGTNMYVSANGPTSIDHGNTATYTLYYNNFGNNPASNAVMQDTLPSGAEFISASDGGTYAPSTGKVTWNLGTISEFPAGKGYKTVTISVPASLPVGTTLTNAVSISTSTLETRYDDNSASVSTQVTGSGLPPDVGVSPTNGNSGGIPSVYWLNPVTFTYNNPSATDVSIKIHVNDGVVDITGPMQLTSSGIWSYTTTFYPRHGAATITYIVAGQPAVTFNIYIDPSGYIYDVATGERISGATIWLQRPDGQGGWENVPTGLNPPVSQPDVNPQITGDDGQYQWDVVEGSYRVYVEVADYYPADSIIVNIPPPVTDLHVGLTRMPDFTPPVSVSNLHNTTYASSYINWTWSNPADRDLAGAMVYLNGVFQTNVTSGVAWYNATDLIPDTEYTVGISTFDRSGNINQTIVTHTAKTAPLDIEPPLTTLVLSGTAGNNSWYVSDVVVNLTATDGADGSGVNITEYGFDGVSWNQYIEPVTIANECTTIVFYRSIDNAGNIEPASNTTLNIDKTTPAIVITTPADGGIYLLNSPLVANWTAVDSLSGIASVNCIAVGELINTSTVGAKTFTISAVDHAGNNATMTSSYVVVYDFQGFMSPIKINNSSIFKHRSTIPVKFRIADANGRYVSTAVANLTYQKISDDILGSIEEPLSKSASDTGNMFRYDTVDDLYIYNLNTDDMSVGSYQLNIYLNDGMVKSVRISIK